MENYSVLNISAQKAWATGGFTLDLRGKAPKSTPCEWLVAVSGFEKRFDHQPTELEVSRYIAGHRVYIEQLGLFVGGWRDEFGEYVLDLSRLVSGCLAAIGSAWKHRQRAIYHPSSGACWPVRKRDLAKRLLSFLFDACFPLRRKEARHVTPTQQ